MSAANKIGRAERSELSSPLSYAQRFMQKKDAVPDAEGWQQVGSRVTEYGGGSGGRGAERRWDNEGGGRGNFPSAFSKPRREEEGRYVPQQKQWGAPACPPPKEISLDSTEDFPTLGKPKAAAKAPQTAGWATKAASWAAADEADAAAERRRQLEQEEADKERRRLTSGIPDLLGRILSRRGDETYRGGFQEPTDDYEVRPRSPPYDPDYENAEYAAAAGAPTNTHLDYEEDNEGWDESR